MFETLVGHDMCVWEEPQLNFQVAQECKKLFTGDKVHVPVKYNTDRQIVKKMLWIITTNDIRLGRGFLPPVDEAALSDRCIDIHLTKTWKEEYGQLKPDTFVQFLFFNK